MSKLDDLTIGEARQLAAMMGALPATSCQPSAVSLVGQKVIVRAYRAGVLYGTLVSVDGETVTLSNARRLWYWVVKDKKGIALEDVANYGVAKESKITETVATAVVIDAGEIMSTSKDAQSSIEGANAYRP